VSRPSRELRRLTSFEKVLNAYQAWLREHAAALDYLTLKAARYADAELVTVHDLLREQAGNGARPAEGDSGPAAREGKGEECGVAPWGVR
jgi:hypothetical protein